MRLSTIAMVCLYALPALSNGPFGTLTVVQAESLPAGPSPLSAVTASDWRFVELVYAPLYTHSTNGFTAWLAESVTVRNEGKTLVVALSDDAQWSAGRDIAARDVVYTYELARQGKWNRAFAAELVNIVRVQAAENGMDIEFELRSPVVTPESLLTVPIIPSGLHGPLDDVSKQRPLPLGVLGAGMYKLADPQDSTRLVHNPNCIRKPRISEVRFISSGDSPTSIDMVRLHGDTVTFDQTPADSSIHDREFGTSVLVHPRPYVLAIAIGAIPSLWNDEAVSSATKQTIDRSALFSIGDGGIPSAVAPTPGVRGQQGSRELPTTNKKSARKRLENAGWKLSIGTRIRTQATDSGTAKRLELPLLIDADDRQSLRRASVLRHQLRVIGIDLRVEASPRLTFLSRLASREFPAALISLRADMTALFHSRGMWNSSGYHDAATDTALESGQWKVAAQRTRNTAPSFVLGTIQRTGVSGRNVMTPRITGRGGFADFHKWRIR